MSLDMIIRTLFVVAGTQPDFTAGKAAAARLVAHAQPAQLHEVLDQGWSPEHPATWQRQGDVPWRLPVEQSRQLVARTLAELLDAAAETFASREVYHYQLGNPHHPGIEAYATGGPHGAESSHAFTAWDILIEDYRLPDGWSATINTAIGLIDPIGTGPPAATVTFHTWT